MMMLHKHTLCFDGAGAIYCTECDFYADGDDLLDLVRDGLRVPALEDEIRRQVHRFSEIDSVLDTAGVPSWKNVVRHGNYSGEWPGDGMTILERVEWLARQAQKA